MTRDAIATDKLATAVGPFSLGVRGDGLLFLSGQVAQDPATGRLLDGDTSSQAEQILRNIATALEAAGKDLGDVIRVGVYLTDMADFAAMNEVYGKHLAPEGVVAPARSTVAVAGLPKDALVEIEVIARDPKGRYGTA